MPTLLSPISALLVGAAAAALLLLLYFLKLRRRTLRLPSTLLWARSFTDIEVNDPFQRLRLSALLILQLLAILCFTIALAEPVIEIDAPGSQRVVILIDRSASMSATDAADGRTRLDAAIERAAALVEDLASTTPRKSIMVVAFGHRAEIVAPFGTRTALTIEAIRSIEGTDEEADLEGALRLATAFASTGDEEAPEPPDVVLYTDGGVAPPRRSEAFDLRAGRLRVVPIEPATPGGVRNVGIVSFSARREIEEPAHVLVFARLVNAGPEGVVPLVTLEVDGESALHERVEIAAASERGPGEAIVSFRLELDRGALLLLRLEKPDVLDADDVAAAVLPPQARPRIALVFDREAPDPRLDELLREAQPEAVRVMTAGAYRSLDQGELDLGRHFDLIVFDRTPPPRLPGVPTITFGALLPGALVVDGADEGGRRIVSWERAHPLMRHVTLDGIVFGGFGRLELPAGATPLAWGPDGPVMAVVAARGAEHVVVGFELPQSNWATDVSFAIFAHNAIDEMTRSRSGQIARVVRPGEPVTARSKPGSKRLRVAGPGGWSEEREAGAPGEVVALPALRRVGVYTVEGAEPPDDRLAVSLLSDVESDIRPRRNLAVELSAPAQGSLHRARREIWWWFGIAGLALLVVEWLLYCRLVRV